MSGFIVRQGDILLRQVDKLPAKAEKVARKRGERVIVAEGEVTGHHHAIADRGVEQYRIPGDTDAQFLRVLAEAGEGVSLVHDEHETIKLPAGDYEVVGQREYSPEEIRRVAD